VRAAARGLLAATGVVLLVSACGSAATPTPSGGTGSRTVTVTMADSGCTASPATIEAGPVTFVISNGGADGVTEVELEKDGTILGEKENLAPGMSGTFSLSLDAGSYVLSCPGASTAQTPFVVTAAAAGAGAASAGASAVTDARLADATAKYADYVRDQVAQLVTSTKAFTDAVEAGDVARSRELYGPARVFYERIEPVAESFGDLDPEIDGRADDAATPADFTGFHRIEQALWQAGDLTGMTPIAQKLQADVEKLQTLVATETYQPAQLANGAAELLDEIASSKVTGEEERYSHLDLLDFQANLDGARETYLLLQPSLQDIDPTLASTIDRRFAEVQSDLDAHRDGDSFVPYPTVTPDQVKALAQAVDALAEPLSQVAAKLVAS